MEKTREEKLEAALLQAIETIFELRQAEKKWHTEFGSTNRRKLQAVQDQADKLLIKMHVNENTVFSSAKIFFNSPLRKDI